MSATFTDAREVFQDSVLIAAPHMDDEILACGGTIAGLPQKDKIHILFATDGSQSPVNSTGWFRSRGTELVSIRKTEAKKALASLGIQEENIHFLDLPDKMLKKHTGELVKSIRSLLVKVNPEHFLIPFRYDRHPDHLVLNYTAHQAVKEEQLQVKVDEYFVYYRYRLLPGGDIRSYISPDHLLRIKIDAFSGQKKEALLHYRSQTTLFYSWQDRPILPPERVEEVAAAPETFLRFDPHFPGSSIFTHSRTWIRLVHYFEPRIKNQKEQIISFQRSWAQYGRKTI